MYKKTKILSPNGSVNGHSEIIAGHGMHKRLKFAFLGIGSLVVIAAVIAIISLWANANNQDRISRQSIPIMTISLDLTRTSQKIVSSVPDLVSIENSKDQERILRELEQEIIRLNELLGALQEYDIDQRAASSIDRAASQFAANIEAIDRVVIARLAIRQSQERLITQGQKAVKQISKLIFASNVASSSIEAINDPEVISQQLQLADGAANIRELSLLLKMQLVPGDFYARNVARKAIKLIKLAPPEIGKIQNAELEKNLVLLGSLYDGPNNLLQQEKFRLELKKAAGQALQENSDLAKRFAEAVNRMVDSAKADVASANTRAKSVQTLASWILISVVVITLISLLLIMRLFVQRYIMARLTDLTSSMMAIANGDLEANIPQSSDDELGSMAQALRVFRDTAVEMRASNIREISKARNRLDHAIESIQEGFALFDAKDKLVLCNSQFGILLFNGIDVPSAGVSYEVLLKQMLKYQINDDDNPFDWYQSTLENHSAPTGASVVRLKDDRWINSTERRTEDGGTVMVITDITALKRHERELDELVKRLRSASAAKSSFVANVSHELRTPLTAVLGFAQIIQNRLNKSIFPKIKSKDEKTRRAISQIQDNIGIMILEGQRLTKMINDVLDLEKIESGQMVWNIEALDIGAILEQAAAATKSLYKKKNLDFQVSVEEGLPKISGDHDKLVQVVINLISNSVKFTDRGHVVCRAVIGEGDFVSVSVTDTGTGISPKDQAEVFDKFRQVGDTLTEKPSGTGLGLPICREIVEQLGGSIALESILGFGSTFTFQIPTDSTTAKAISRRGKS